LTLTLAACSPDGGGATAPPAASTPPSATPTPSPTSAGEPDAATASPAAFATQAVRLAKVADLDQPLAMDAPEGTSDVYIAEKTGRVRVLHDGRLDPKVVLDVSDQVSQGGEQGLLGIAVAPDRAHLYVNLTNQAGDTRIYEYALSGGRADEGSQRELLAVDQPYSNHNGGEIVFGPDDLLYIGLGDGGSGGDPHGNGQNLGVLLGKILRIDPRPADGRPYGIPADNPFADRAGARGEIWSYGLRNPWRFSFDPAGGAMWIGDVGQNQYEEVDAEPAGAGGRNYGWNLREGRHEFDGPRPEGAVDPVIEYGREDGCTVIGGVVYRGRAIPGLRGAYLYSDFCGGWVKAVRTEGGRPAGQPRDLGLNVASPSSFGTDQRGDVWVLSLAGPVYKLQAG
jgi:glucose/arabinose dehydrogenase